MSSNIFDIRTSDNALSTLTNLSGVSKEIWEKYLGHEQEYEYVDDLVEDVIRSHGHIPNSFMDFEFIFFHVTTSANGCKSFLQTGILDLRNTYLCPQSELRQFLDAHDIIIDLSKHILTHAGNKYNIEFGECPKSNTKEYFSWSVGRKFYYDFSICGFLSVCDIIPYGGLVHTRPEFLMNMDKLLNLSLSREWADTHTTYQVTAKVPGDMIIFNGDDDWNDTKRVIYYLTKAYDTAFGTPREEILLIKDEHQIPPQNIIDISPFTNWQKCNFL